MSDELGAGQWLMFTSYPWAWSTRFQHHQEA